jgi:hypothetical protein
MSYLTRASKLLHVLSSSRIQTTLSIPSSKPTFPGINIVELIGLIKRNKASPQLWIDYDISFPLGEPCNRIIQCANTICSSRSWFISWRCPKRFVMQRSVVSWSMREKFLNLHHNLVVTINHRSTEHMHWIGTVVSVQIDRWFKCHRKGNTKAYKLATN